MDPTVIIKILTWSTIAFGLSIALTPIYTTAAYRWRWGKHLRSAAQAPVFFKLHKNKAGTPTMGGLLVWIPVILLTLVSSFVAPEWSFLSRSQTYLPLGAMIAAALVGMIDDVTTIIATKGSPSGLRIRYRLLFYTTIAVVVSVWFYGKLEWDHIVVPSYGFIALGGAIVLYHVFIIVATAFSVNESDGLDGLAGGMLAISFATLAAIAAIQGRNDLATFGGVVVGSLLSFLWFNIPPARFFMGDTGAMGLGVTLAVVAMLTNTTLLLPLIGIVLVAESLSVLLQIMWRKLFKQKLFLSAPLHHHLEAIGWPEPKIVMRAWVISAVSAVLSLLIVLLDPLFH